MLIESLLLLATSQKPVVRVSFPSLGVVECRGRGWPRTNTPALVVCRDASNHRVLSFRIAGEYIRLKALEQSPLGISSLVAVGIEVGGSDSQFTTALISERNGRLVDLWPEHWSTNESDALCLGEFRRGEIGVLRLKFIWGRGCGESHYAPHRFRATRYLWNGSTFSRVGSKATRGRVADWRTAAAELGYTCPTPYGGVDLASFK